MGTEWKYLLKVVQYLNFDLTFNESYAINKEFVETKMKLDWTWGRYPSPPPRVLAQFNAFVASQETVLETVR